MAFASIAPFLAVAARFGYGARMAWADQALDGVVQFFLALVVGLYVGRVGPDARLDDAPVLFELGLDFCEHWGYGLREKVRRPLLRLSQLCRVVLLVLQRLAEEVVQVLMPVLHVAPLIAVVRLVI